MAFSKVKVGGLADDSVTAANIDDDGTGYTVGNLTNSGTLQQTGQVTIGTGSGSGGSFTLPTSRGANDKYVLQIDTTAGAANWVESLVAPEVSSHNFDVSGSTDDGDINAYEAPYTATGNTTNGSNSIASISVTSSGDDINDLKVGQFVSGTGIPANTVIKAISGTTITLKDNTTGADTNATVTNTGTALSIQKTPGEKNGGKVTLTGTNFGVNVADITVAITTSGGGIIANASYITGLTATSVTAEWTGTEGSYSTDLTSSYTGKIYFKITKSGLASNVYDTNTTLTTDATLTTLTTSSQTGGDRSATPSATSLGTYGSGIVAGGGQDSNTKLLLNFDRGGGTDIEDSSNIAGVGGYKSTATNATIKASPFGDGKSAMYFDGSNDKLEISMNADFLFGSSDFTIEWWAYNLTGSRGLGYETWAGANGDFQTAYMNTSGLWATTIKATDGTSFAHTHGKDLRYEWHHFAVCRNGNNLRLFVDGVTSKTHDVTGKSFGKNSGTLWLGYTDNSVWGYGYLDEMRVVNGTAVYTDDFTVPTSRLTAITNTKLLIHSNVNNFTPNMVVLNEGSYNGSRSAHGSWPVHAIDLDGDNNEIQPSSLPEIQGEPWTLEGWFYRDGANTENNGQTFFSTKDHSFGVMLTNSNTGNGTTHITFYFGDGSSWDSTNDHYEISGSGTSWGSGWNHFVFQRAANNYYQMFLNGYAMGQRQYGSMPGYNYFKVGEWGNSTALHNWNGQVNGIRYSNIARYTYDSTRTNLSYTPSATPFTPDANTILLLTGEELYFDDSSASNHTIARSGVVHSGSYGGIATATSWPANGQTNGTSGAYFDGTNSKIVVDVTSAFIGANAALTIDFWVFPHNNTGSAFLYDWRSGSAANGYMHLNTTNRFDFMPIGGPSAFTTPDTAAGKINFNQWNHICYVRDTSGNYELYLRGTRIANGTGDTGALDNTDLYLGSRFSSANWFRGWISNFRVTTSNEAASGGSLYNTAANTITVPTRAYGAFGQETPDVGTITLTATGSGDYTWSEVAGGTALPGTLAVGSTAHSGSGNSRTHTATITGSFSALTTSFANGTRSALTTNNILLKAQNDADSTKAITLGSSGGYDGISITQKSTEKPILFNGRRYKGTGTDGRGVSDFGFQPDVVWIKNRNSSGVHHGFYDSVRGVNAADGNKLVTNQNIAQNNSGFGYGNIQIFTKNGFTLEKGTQNSHGHTNATDDTYISWGWKAGGAPDGNFPSSLTDGIGNGTLVSGSLGYSDIAAGSALTVKQSVNTNSGFSITYWDGSGGSNNQHGGKIPHNLGSGVAMVIVKRVDAAGNWMVFHKDMGTSTSGGIQHPNFMELDTNGPKTNGAETHTGNGTWGSSSGNTSVPNMFAQNFLQYGTEDDIGGVNAKYVMYAWKPVAGVSAFGALSNVTSAPTQSSDETWCGFKPKFVMIKKHDASGPWHVFDKFRNSTDTWNNRLQANEPDQEDAPSNAGIVVTANGFYTQSDSAMTGNNLIWMAFS